MNDRELLELAAKSVGNPQGTSRSGGGLLMANDLYWNPLTDDGDALRLAVKLDLLNSPRVAHEIAVERFTRNADKLTATRRAIVRAAAEIGKGMK
jgi:hypothetical protein